MSEPLVGPDAAEVEKPGPAFDGDGENDTAAVPEAAASPEPEAVASDEGLPDTPEVDEGALHRPPSDPEPEAEAEPEPEADPDAATLEAQLLAAAPEEAIEDSGLPDLTDDRELDAALESVLLVVDSPIAEDQLSSALEQPVKRIKEALRRLSTRYTESGSGIDLRRAGDGWRFYTRDRYAPFVEKLLLDGQRAKLTRAALETLAVIAYRQPVTRARVAAVRGVNVDGVIRTLVARGLIEETGTDSDTGGILYRTTELFLERLGLSSLHDLPPIAPLLPEVDAIDDV
ncbi:SMC-Scp complex subunit ScpB [Lentzea flava]|uniref:Segregation and condensation protein B n=1 Tax=Lentzea flava TaxID=103732 RepID=A0ABQ2UXS5_9PSEU|nr:SMC-Scp complex subunit ScpB [Lentzea flava]MCP2202145.1 condensin subunit ScpB [Lentzea flava]GGU57319.1 segregation and condensation protein B [Lentzea flava]